MYKRGFHAYLVTNRITGSQYVGISIYSFRYRWNRHRAEAKSGRSQSKFYRAIRKYGEENFDVQHIASAISRENLMALEKILITQYSSHVDFGGYNLTSGGEHPIISIETRLKHSANARNRIVSEETKDFLRKLGKGRKHSEESKQIRKMKMEIWWSDPTNRAANSAKRSVANRGRGPLDETKVRAIRSALSGGAKSNALATQFGVSTSTISEIYTSKKWKGVGDEEGCFRRRMENRGETSDQFRNTSRIAGKRIGTEIRT